MARRLEREGMPWTAALAALVVAAAENAEGNRAGTLTALREGRDASERAGMSMHTAAANHRLGQLIGGEEGDALVRSAAEVLAGEGIRNAARWIEIYLPGAWGTRSG
jgi:hypothetical protein